MTSPAATGPAATPNQVLIQNGDFERGQTGWRVKTRADRRMIGNSRAHSGNQSAGLCGYNDCDEALAQTINIPDGAKNVRLSYYTLIETQENMHAFDFLNVEIRDARGKKLRAIQQLSDGDMGDEWHQSSFDLSEFASKTVELVFEPPAARSARPSSLWMILRL